MIALLTVIAILLGLILFAILNREGAKRLLAGAWGTAVWLMFGCFVVALLAFVWWIFRSMTLSGMAMLGVFAGLLLVAR
jgi:di/tricarboxylate transporter